MKKKCKDCLQEKSIEEFYTSKSNTDGLNNRCKLCYCAFRQPYQRAANNTNKNKDTKYRKNYGIGLEEVKELARLQNYLCLICGEKKKLYVDHSHKTFKVRGLLCYSCNIALGHFKDSTKVLLNAISYLERSKENEA